jgi:hypothetical protein
MRFNYGHVKRAALKMFDIQIEQSPSRGVVLVFNINDTEDRQDRVRVVLVDGPSYGHEQGIHLSRIESREDLERSLADAVETALKDMFPTIWIHQPYRPSVERREARLKCALSWLKANEGHVASNYNLSKLQVNPEQVLAGMTEEQLDVVNALVAGTFSRASDETRAYWSPKYHEQRKRAEAATAVSEQQAVSRE